MSFDMVKALSYSITLPWYYQTNDNRVIFVKHTPYLGQQVPKIIDQMSLRALVDATTSQTDWVDEFSHSLVQFQTFSQTKNGFTLKRAVSIG